MGHTSFKIVTNGLEERGKQFELLTNCGKVFVWEFGVITQTIFIVARKGRETEFLKQH